MNEQIKAFLNEMKYVVAVVEDFLPDLPLVGKITVDLKYYWVIPGQNVGYLEFKETLRELHLKLNSEVMFSIDRRFSLDGVPRKSRSYHPPKHFHLTSNELLLQNLDELEVAVFSEEPTNVQSVTTTVEGKQLWFVSRIKINTDDLVRKIAQAFYHYDPDHELAKDAINHVVE